jgi:diguanylate cyclase (GGDEF)-like protein
MHAVSAYCPNQSSYNLISYRTSLFAMVALLLSALALLGHMMDLPILASLLNGQQQMVISTASGLLISAMVLIANEIFNKPASRVFLNLVGFAILIVGILGLLEFKLDMSWLDFNALHKHNPKANPGRMAFITAICFVLLGLSILLDSFLKQQRFRYLVTGCLTALGLLSMLGVLSFLANFEFLSSFGRSNRMALPTALSFLALTLAINASHKAKKNINQEVSGSIIHTTLEIMLVLIVMVVALLSFALSQQRVESLMSNQLDKVGTQSRDYFNNAFILHHQSAVFQAEKTELESALLTYQKNPKRNLSEQLRTFNNLHYGFSMLSLETPEHQVIFQVGNAVKSELTLQIFSNPASYLLWSDGYYLRTTVPKYNPSGDLLGFVVIEQYLDDITRFHRNAIEKPGTSDLVLCGLDGDYQTCYPFRWSKKPARYYGFLDGKALPITRAVIGFTETTVATDYRRERVMVALGPVGHTGLGMAIKIDMHELYEPIRNQFYASLPFFIFMTLLSLLLMRLKLKPLIDGIEQSRHRLSSLALQDSLTGLANRTLFHDRLEFAINKIARTHKKIGLIYLDIDYFKIINDTYGHIVGDQVLVWFAKQLRDSVRQSDTVARIGGDEFCIIVEDIAGKSDVAKIATQILEKLNCHLSMLENGPVSMVTASLGIVVAASKDIAPDKLVALADQALYRAKQKGRNTFELVELDEV